MTSDPGKKKSCCSLGFLLFGLNFVLIISTFKVITEYFFARQFIRNNAHEIVTRFLSLRNASSKSGSKASSVMMGSLPASGAGTPTNNGGSPLLLPTTSSPAVMLVSTPSPALMSPNGAGLPSLGGSSFFPASPSVGVASAVASVGVMRTGLIPLRESELEDIVNSHNYSLVLPNDAILPDNVVSHGVILLYLFVFVAGWFGLFTTYLIFGAHIGFKHRLVALRSLVCAHMLTVLVSCAVIASLVYAGVKLRDQLFSLSTVLSETSTASPTGSHVLDFWWSVAKMYVMGKTPGEIDNVFHYPEVVPGGIVPVTDRVVCIRRLLIAMGDLCLSCWLFCVSTIAIVISLVSFHHLKKTFDECNRAQVEGEGSDDSFGKYLTKAGCHDIFNNDEHKRFLQDALNGVSSGDNKTYYNDGNRRSRSKTKSLKKSKIYAGSKSNLVSTEWDTGLLDTYSRRGSGRDYGACENNLEWQALDSYYDDLRSGTKSTRSSRVLAYDHSGIVTEKNAPGEGTLGNRVDGTLSSECQNTARKNLDNDVVEDMGQTDVVKNHAVTEVTRGALSATPERTDDTNNAGQESGEVAVKQDEEHLASSPTGEETAQRKEDPESDRDDINQEREDPSVQTLTNEVGAANDVVEPIIEEIGELSSKRRPSLSKKSSLRSSCASTATGRLTTSSRQVPSTVSDLVVSPEVLPSPEVQGRMTRQMGDESAMKMIPASAQKVIPEDGRFIQSKADKLDTKLEDTQIEKAPIIVASETKPSGIAARIRMFESKKESEKKIVAQKAAALWSAPVAIPRVSQGSVSSKVEALRKSMEVSKMENPPKSDPSLLRKKSGLVEKKSEIFEKKIEEKSKLLEATNPVVVDVVAKKDDPDKQKDVKIAIVPTVHATQVGVAQSGQNTAKPAVTSITSMVSANVSPTANTTVTQIQTKRNSTVMAANSKTTRVKLGDIAPPATPGHALPPLEAGDTQPPGEERRWSQLSGLFDSKDREPILVTQDVIQNNINNSKSENVVTSNGKHLVSSKSLKELANAQSTAVKNLMAGQKHVPNERNSCQSSIVDDVESPTSVISKSVTVASSIGSSRPSVV